MLLAAAAAAAVVLFGGQPAVHAAEGVPGALAAEPPAQLRRLGNDEVL